ncbi:MAG: uroporphyrinogen decarboxylase [Trueperaceae bacterium]|nr:MAG: uroporphyrinogen decarboxylase [Trueperaceae bacterium]
MSLFLDAARGADTQQAPVWIMRQAGRYLPEYRALKERYSFWELCRTPELVLEITLQPIRRFGFDAAILFSDIMTPLPPMGVEIDFSPGPVFRNPLRTEAQIDALRLPTQEEIAPFVVDAVHLIRSEANVPLIGFAGAPLTLATYMVQGGGSKDYATFRQFLRQVPEGAHRLLEALTEVTIRYLRAQVEAGVQAVQLFDSWAGLHDANTYREFSKPYNRRVFEALAESGVPRIYLAVNSLHLYDEITELPCEVVSVDWRVPLSTVRELLPSKTLQGNLDPANLLAPEEHLLREVDRVLLEGLGGPHIFNLGHGIFPQTDPDNVERLVERVRAFDRLRAEGKP